MDLKESGGERVRGVGVARVADIDVEGNAIRPVQVRRESANQHVSDPKSIEKLDGKVWPKFR